jgi:ABC-2 type transport system ATP-binding protein
MLQATHLTKQYNGQTALNDLSLNVAPGEIYCLLGQNGAGKTTTINLFLGFIEPTSGSARINGLEVTTHPLETKKFVAYLPETVMLYPHLTGLENLQFFSELAGFRYVDHALEAFLSKAGLQAEAHRKRVGTYSKGMRQKVGIAIALAKEAKALLLDEPTSGLDPKASNEFSDLLTGLSQQGVAVLMATHDLFRAREVGTRVGIMKEGRLVQTLNPADINAAELERVYLKTV